MGMGGDGGMIRLFLYKWCLNQALNYSKAADFWFLGNPVGTIGFARGELFQSWSNFYFSLAKAFVGKARDV